jgi:hypothetical protein
MKGAMDFSVDSLFFRRIHVRDPRSHLADPGRRNHTVLIAQAPALDVKAGLWENTVVTTMGMAVRQVDTSKMPPEQAAKIAEAMKGMMGDS